MGKLAVYKYISLLFLVATTVLSIFTFVGLNGGNSNPVYSTFSAMLVYVLPLLIIANVVVLLIWIIRRRWHWALIPLITILCCIPYINTIYKFGSEPKETNSKGGLKIATYNVALFQRETTGFIAQDILSHMKKQKVDILCMQEYSDKSGDQINSENYKDYFTYMARGAQDMIIFSRYPIIKSEKQQFEQTNNSSMWADIDVNGTVIRVFNVHLETTGINSTLHRAGKAIAAGKHVTDNQILNAVYGNYEVGMIARAGQANMIAMERMKTDHPCIICGDFNDVPYSYVYNTMLGDLVDGFKECGHSGLMNTFRGGKKLVRIDYIFHDKAFKGVNYYKYELSYSDHYPVFLKLEL